VRLNKSRSVFENIRHERSDVCSICRCLCADTDLPEALIVLVNVFSPVVNAEFFFLQGICVVLSAFKGYEYLIRVDFHTDLL